MSNVNFIESSNRVQIELPDGRFIEGDRGDTLEHFLAILRPELKYDLMAGIVNNELRELSYQIEHPARVEPITTADADGWLLYRRTLTFLMAACFEELYPDCDLEIRYAMQASGCFVCEVHGMDFGENEMRELEVLMRKKVSQNEPITRVDIPIEEARQLFRAKKQQDKLDVLEFRVKPFLMAYLMDDFVDYNYGYMLPSAGYVKYFHLESYKQKNSFLLRLPKDGKTTQISDIHFSQAMVNMFTRYNHCEKTLEIHNVAAINRAITRGRIEDVILVAESLQNQSFVQAADEIAAANGKIRVVLIAGPSSSGKTTSSKRLSVELLARGISPIPIEMDNFFVSREHTPRDENGNYDFECLGAMNTELLMEDVSKLIAGETVQLPHFNFKTGEPEPGETVHLDDNQILILEGIHGLNPNLLPNIPAEQIYRIFIAPFTQVNIDRYNRISTTDVRLLRRIVRDFRDRGRNAQATISGWASVRAGEEKNILPYQNLANIVINTSLIYELSALKQLAEPALRMVPYDSREFIEAKRLLALLEWVLPLDLALVPSNSILAEFIGGSNLKNFTEWNV